MYERNHARMDCYRNCSFDCSYLRICRRRSERQSQARGVDRGFAEWVVKGQDKTEFKWKEKQ